MESFQRLGLRGIDDVMERPGGDDHRVGVAHLVLFIPREDERGLPLLDPKELVNFGCTSLPDSSPGCRHITTSTTSATSS